MLKKNAPEVSDSTCVSGSIKFSHESPLWFINYADLKCSTQTALLSIPGHPYPGSSEGTYLMIRNTEIWVQTSALALSHQTKWNLTAYSSQLGHHQVRK